jgi:acetolactate synthase-1/2/3 large subunit
MADALVLTLRDLGVEHVFGVSGANIEDLHDAVYRLGEGRIVNRLCKSEIGASFMADGYSRFKGTIGVCCSTSGGGMMNLAVGVAEARASGTPLLAVVGCPPSGLAGRGAFQDASGNGITVDAAMLWRAVGKCVIDLNGNFFWEKLFQAFSDALSGKPGPSVLLIPKDVMTSTVPPRPDWWPLGLDDFRFETGLPVKRVAALEAAIGSARSPVIIAGPEFSNRTALVAFSERTGIPVASTLGATSSFPNSHPHYLGMAGVAGHPSVHRVIEECDLLIALGCQMEAMIRAPFEPSLTSKTVYIFNRNTEWAPKGSHVRTITASPDSVLTVLNSSGSLPEKRFYPVRIPERQYHAARVCSQDPSGSDLLRQSEALSILQAYLPENGKLIFDAGNCAAAAAHYLTIPDGVRSLVGLGMAGMGYGLCSAIGAHLADPQSPTVAVCGDGAFLMAGMEIHTAIEWGLPILWIIFNDSQHGMCTSRQRHFFDGRLTCSRYGDVDVDHVVSGFGGAEKLWHGQAVTPGDMKRLLIEYHAGAPMPGVLELKIRVEEIPPFFPLTVE